MVGGEANALLCNLDVNPRREVDALEQLIQRPSGRGHGSENGRRVGRHVDYVSMAEICGRKCNNLKSIAQCFFLFLSVQ